jgi:putative nucleotidyltransferase with HDIG domain
MNTIQALIRLQEETGAEVLIVGGFVRDLLRGKRNKDLDIVIRNLSYQKIIDFLSEYGSCKRVKLALTADTTQTSVLLFRAHNDALEAQITQPRKGKRLTSSSRNKIVHDVACRDFKVNALYLPIDFQSRSEVIDLIGGRKDIKNRTISCVGGVNECLSQSPVRVLRAVSLAAVTGYRISGGLLNGMSKYATALKNVPAECIRKELDKVLLSRKPSTYLRLMAKCNILDIILPELSKCIGVSQDKRYHKYDVFTHCIYTCDNIEPDIVLRLAGLLHDIGKVTTRKEMDGRVTFYKHEIAGVKLARVVLDRLKYSKKVKYAVLELIRHHMYHYTREQTDSAVRRFIKRVGINKNNISNLGELPLFKLRRAERLGNGLKTNPVTDRQIDFENRIKEIFDNGGGLTISDLEINGTIIMQALDIKSGEFVGEIKSYLLDRVREDRSLNNRYTLLELALSYVRSKERTQTGGVSHK